MNSLFKVSGEPKLVGHKKLFSSTFDPFSSSKHYSPYKPFTSNYNPFASQKFSIPKGKREPNQKDEEKKHSTTVINAENNTFFNLPCSIEYESDEEESNSDCNSDESKEDGYSDDEILDTFEDDHLEALKLEDDLNIPLSVLRLTSIKAKIYSSQLARREELHKKLCSSSIIKLLKLPLEVFSLFCLISLFISIIINKIT